MIESHPVGADTGPYFFIHNRGDVTKIKQLSVFLGAVLLAGCATPHVVDEQQVADDKMTCSELDQAIAEARDFEEKARDEKGVTGTNVVAGIFFPLAIVGTYSNANEAIEAAEDRQEHLQDMKKEKGC